MLCTSETQNISPKLINLAMETNQYIIMFKVIFCRFHSYENINRSCAFFRDLKHMMKQNRENRSRIILDFL